VCEYVENTIPAGVHVCTHRCKKFTRYRHNRDTNSVRAVTERLSDRTAQWQNESLPNWRKEQVRDEEERSDFLCVVNCLQVLCIPIILWSVFCSCTVRSLFLALNKYQTYTYLTLSSKSVHWFSHRKPTSCFEKCTKGDNVAANDAWCVKLAAQFSNSLPPPFVLLC